jgi:hypothetical protein
LLEVLDVDLKKIRFIELQDRWEELDGMAAITAIDADRLCAFVRAIHARCGTVEGECPRYDDPHYNPDVIEIHK